MAITLTAAQRAAADNPAAEVKLVLEWDVTSGRMYMATEPLSWSGIEWKGRIKETPRIASALNGATTTTAFEVADVDGYFGTRRPEFYRLQRVAAHEIFQDVNSAPIRTTRFTVTGTRKNQYETFTVEAEDVFAPYRRAQFPSNNVLITRSLYPNIPNGVPYIGQPIPFIIGRVMTPCYLVDTTSADVYVCCVGCAHVVSGTATMFADLFDGGFSRVVGSVVTDANGTNLAPYSFYYAPRGGLMVTECIVRSGIPLGGQIVRYADLTIPGSDTQNTTPDRALLAMLSNSYAGVCFDPTLIDSDTLLAARSLYSVHSLFLDCAITQQRPLQEWLGDWEHDSRTRLVMRDKIRLVPQFSGAPTASAHAGNVVWGSMRMQDLPVGNEGSRYTVAYTDRAQHAGSVNQYTYNAGSAAEVVHFSPFIGRTTVAAQTALHWARDAYYGQRLYRWEATVKGAAGVEEGDLLSHTHSITGTNQQLCRVLGLTRTAGEYELEVKETDVRVFEVVSPWPDDSKFGAAFQRIYVDPHARAAHGQFAGQQFFFNFVQSGSTVYAVTSHQLDGTPVQVRALSRDGNFSAILLNSGFPASTFFTNNSIFTTAIYNTAVGSVRMTDHFFGWEIALWKYTVQ